MISASPESIMWGGDWKEVSQKEENNQLQAARKAGIVSKKKTKKAH